MRVPERETEGGKSATVEEKMGKNLCAPLTLLGFFSCIIPMVDDLVVLVSEPI